MLIYNQERTLLKARQETPAFEPVLSHFHTGTSGKHKRRCTYVDSFIECFFFSGESGPESINFLWFGRGGLLLSWKTSCNEVYAHVG